MVSFRTILSIILVFLNIVWIIYTLKSQDVVELSYNIVVVVLNIIYFGITAIENND
jgi:hypothetical protein